MLLCPFAPLRKVCSDLLHSLVTIVAWWASSCAATSKDDDADANLFSTLEGGFMERFRPFSASGPVGVGTNGRTAGNRSLGASHGVWRVRACSRTVRKY